VCVCVCMCVCVCSIFYLLFLKVGASVKGTVLAHQADGALRIKTVIGGKTFTGSIREVRGYRLCKKTSYQSLYIIL
jgi:hypothetical protein